jgi:hypothetical protein
MPLDKKYEIMEQAHCFLIPSSFKSENHENYRYSFPTKLPELIASGRPIISYGPSNTATNRLLAGHKLGTRINHRSVSKVVYCLSRIIDRYDETLQEVSSANSKIIQFFSADKARNTLSDILNVS